MLCTNTAGSFSCGCNIGYDYIPASVVSGTSHSCQNYNECTTTLSHKQHSCDSNAVCTDTVGTYYSKLVQIVTKSCRLAENCRLTETCHLTENCRLTETCHLTETLQKFNFLSRKLHMCLQHWIPLYQYYNWSHMCRY